VAYSIKQGGYSIGKVVYLPKQEGYSFGQRVLVCCFDAVFYVFKPVRLGKTKQVSDAVAGCFVTGTNPGRVVYE